MMGIKGIGTLYTLKNGNMTAVIDSFGAKVLGIFTGDQNILFYDENDIGHSGIPICLPNFGPLKDGQFVTGNQSFPMGQHGFYRDSEFEVEQASDSVLTCILTASENTKEHYPYDFSATLRYELTNNGLLMGLTVINNDTSELPIAPGFHPYFAVKNPDSVVLNTKATNGNDNSAGYTSKTLEESGVFNLESVDEAGIKQIRVINVPDIHLIDHGLNETTISSENMPSILMTADMSVFNRMTIWRKTADVSYICVEPAYEQNGINVNPIVVKSGEFFDTTVSIEIA